MADARTALVTGGAGFIGSHLVDRLLTEGYRVVVVDDLSTGKLKNLNPSATFHHSDITQPSIKKIFERTHPDLVFHLAAQVSVTNSTKEPINDANINVTSMDHGKTPMVKPALSQFLPKRCWKAGSR